MYEQARCHGGVATHSCNVGLLRQTFLPQNFTIILLVDCLTLWHVFTMHNSIIIEEKKKASIIWNWCCSIVLFGSVRCRGLPLRRLDLSFGDIPRIHHQLWLFLKFSSFSTHSSRPGAAVTRACFVDPGFFSDMAIATKRFRYVRTKHCCIESKQAGETWYATCKYTPRSSCADSLSVVSVDPGFMPSAQTLFDHTSYVWIQEAVSVRKRSNIKSYKRQKQLQGYKQPLSFHEFNRKSKPRQ